MSRTGRIIAIAVLGLMPTTLPAQRVTSDHAGLTPHSVALVITTQADTVTIDSIAPHRNRAVDATVGGLVGTIAGGLAGAIYAQQGAKHCGDGPCMVGLAIPFFAGIGLVVGAVAGAMWRTH